MPTFYEGDPVEVVQICLTKQDFKTVYLLHEKNIAPLHHPFVKTGLCLTVAVLIGSAIPYYLTFYSTVWMPVCVIFLFLLGSVFFYKVQPDIIGKWAEKVFTTNLLLAEPMKVSVYRDCVICETKFEKYQEYWTNFQKCLENVDFFIFTGGMTRQFLIIPKNGLNENTKTILSEHFKNIFVSKYCKIK